MHLVSLSTLPTYDSHFSRKNEASDNRGLDSLSFVKLTDCVVVFRTLLAKPLEIGQAVGGGRQPIEQLNISIS